MKRGHDYKALRNMKISLVYYLKMHLNALVQIFVMVSKQTIIGVIAFFNFSPRSDYSTNLLVYTQRLFQSSETY